MGNCLVIQHRKEMKVMSEIFKALPPPLSKGSDAATANDGALGPRKQNLGLDLDVRVGGMGQLHRLFPSESDVKEAPSDPGAVVRVKLVISKQELRRMLGEDGMVALMPRGSEDEKQEDIRAGWRPALHSIPEGSGDLYSLC